MRSHPFSFLIKKKGIYKLYCKIKNLAIQSDNRKFEIKTIF